MVTFGMCKMPQQGCAPKWLSMREIKVVVATQGNVGLLRMLEQIPIAFKESAWVFSYIYNTMVPQPQRDWAVRLGCEQTAHFSVSMPISTAATSIVSQSCLAQYDVLSAFSMSCRGQRVQDQRLHIRGVQLPPFPKQDQLRRNRKCPCSREPTVGYEPPQIDYVQYVDTAAILEFSTESGSETWPTEKDVAELHNAPVSEHPKRRKQSKGRTQSGYAPTNKELIGDDMKGASAGELNTARLSEQPEGGEQSGYEPTSN